MGPNQIFFPVCEERAPQPHPQGLPLDHFKNGGLFEKWRRPWGLGCEQQTPQQCRIVQNGDTF